MTKLLPKSPFTLQAGKRFAEQHDLMSLADIADEWHRISGQRLSPARIYQILRVAEAKMAPALREYQADLQ